VSIRTEETSRRGSMRRADGKKSPQRKKRIGRAEGGLYIDIGAVGRGGRGGGREGGREGGRCDPVVSARARWRGPGGEEELWHARWGGERRHWSCENDGMHLAPSDGPEPSFGFLPPPHPLVLLCAPGSG